MSAYWVKFADGTAGCIETTAGQNPAVVAANATGRIVASVATLPHPAEPRLNKIEHPKHGASPSFCYRPEQCKGRTACPQPYSCTE